MNTDFFFSRINYIQISDVWIRNRIEAINFHVISTKKYLENTDKRPAILNPELIRLAIRAERIF